MVFTVDRRPTASQTGFARRDQLVKGQLRAEFIKAKKWQEGWVENKLPSKTYILFRLTTKKGKLKYQDKFREIPDL